MIQAQDLCIGNWVYDGEHTKFPMFVRAIGEDYVYLDFPQNEGDLWECKPDDLEGIPLAAELLEKIGFRKVTDIRWCNAERDYNIEVAFWHKGYAQVEIKSLNNRVMDTCNHSHIYYLHELQNLFWNITKQQLKIEL